MRNLMLLILLVSSSALADTQVTLGRGQCTQVNGRNYCWFYRPSVWDHPDQPPRPCDFRKDCPLTLLIPATPETPNLYTPEMAQHLTDKKKKPQQQDVSIMLFCRERGEDDFILVKVITNDKTGEKKEIIINEYKDDDTKCMRDEARYGTETEVSSYGGGSSVIVDNYSAPGTPCPYNQRTEIKRVRAADVWKGIKKIF